MHQYSTLNNSNTYSVQKHNSEHMLNIYRESKAIQVFKSTAKERCVFYNLGNYGVVSRVGYTAFRPH